MAFYGWHFIYSNPQEIQWVFYPNPIENFELYKSNQKKYGTIGKFELLWYF